MNNATFKFAEQLQLKLAIWQYTQNSAHTMLSHTVIYRPSYSEKLTFYDDKFTSVEDAVANIIQQLCKSKGSFTTGVLSAASAK